MQNTQSLNINDIKEYLIKKNIKPSYHRIKILKYLKEHIIHPTVEMIYKNLIKEIPTLSKTTVYNTLNLFVKNKILIELIIDENEIRYDINTEIHAHFQSKRCSIIYDIEIEPSCLDGIYIQKNHKISEYHIYFKGFCADCIKNKKCS